MTLNPVKFGTSGHRGIINSTFTLSHIKAIGFAISQIIKKETGKIPHIVIGYDPREGNSTHLEPQSFTKILEPSISNF